MRYYDYTKVEERQIVHDSAFLCKTLLGWSKARFEEAVFVNYETLPGREDALQCAHELQKRGELEHLIEWVWS